MRQSSGSTTCRNKNNPWSPALSCVFFLYSEGLVVRQLRWLETSLLPRFMLSDQRRTFIENDTQQPGSRAISWSTYVSPTVLHAVAASFIFADKVQPCLLITDIPCRIEPIAERLHAGLLQGGGALPRNAEGQVCLKELQHVGARAHEFPDLHEVKVPPKEFPSPTVDSASEGDCLFTVYMAYAAGQPEPSVQAHLDFRALLQRAGDVVESNREIQAAERAAAEEGASGVSDWSSSPKRISNEAETTLKSLHKKGWHAMTLFEVVLVYWLWFGAAGSAAPAEEAQGPAPTPVPRPAMGAEPAAEPRAEPETSGVDGVEPESVPGMGSEAGSGGDDTPPLRKIADLRRSEFLLIAMHLREVLRVAIGATSSSDGLADMTLPGFVVDHILYADNTEEAAGETTPAVVLRDIGAAVERYHEVRCWCLGFIFCVFWVSPG